MSGTYAQLDLGKKSAGVIANITAKILDKQYAAKPDKFLKPESYHVTLLYSRVPADGYTPKADTQYEATVKDVEFWDTHDECVVLTLNCPKLVNHHKSLMTKYGLTWDHPSYKPHITLVYDTKPEPSAMDALKQALVGKPVILTNETVESLDEDHSDIGDSK